MVKMANHLLLMFYSLFIVFALQKNAAAAVRYYVGDNLGWTVPPNISFYSEWTNSKTFQIGDTVAFNGTGTNNMAEVGSIAEYENCTNPGITFDSSIFINLISNGSRFFVCTISNYCERGQKVIITVGSPTNTSSLFLTPSSASTLKTGVSLLVFSIISFSFFNYF